MTRRGRKPAPIVYHHIHFINKVRRDAELVPPRALNATERRAQHLTDFFAGADLPGVGYSLNFPWEGDRA